MSGPNFQPIRANNQFDCLLNLSQSSQLASKHHDRGKNVGRVDQLINSCLQPPTGANQSPVGGNQSLFVEKKITHSPKPKSNKNALYSVNVPVRGILPNNNYHLNDIVSNENREAFSKNIQAIKKKETQEITQAIIEDLKTYGFQDALQLLKRKVRSRQFQLTTKLANELMYDCASNGNWKEAQNFWELMKKYHTRPNVFTYNCLITAILRDKNPNFHSRKKLDLIEPYIKEMEEKNIELNHFIYRNLIHANFNDENLEKVVDWLQNAGNKLENPKDLTKIIHWYLKLDQIDPATDLFSKLLKLKASNQTEEKQTEEELKESKSYSIACNHLLRWYSKCNHFKKYEKLLQTMEENDISKNNETYSIMIDHALHAKQGHYIQTGPILKDGKIEDERWAKANEIFNEWKEKQSKKVNNKTRELHCERLTTNCIKVQILNWFIHQSAGSITLFALPLQSDDSKEEVLLRSRRQQDIIDFVKKYIPNLACSLKETNGILLERKKNKE